MLVLFMGRFKVLDKIIKMVIILLTVSTLVAVISAFGLDTKMNTVDAKSFDWLNSADIFFLIAFIGWMPAPIDLSVWQSMWNVEKFKTLGFRPNKKQCMLDFRIGFIGTILLAISFVLLGAQVMHGSGETLSPNGTQFAGQLIKLYTSGIGGWAYTIIAVAAITTMFSTTITVLDAYPRVLKPSSEILIPGIEKKFGNSKYNYFFWMAILVFGGILLMTILSSTMTVMVDLATTISFVLAPILAFMNYKVVTGKTMPENEKPNRLMKIWAWIGIVFLSLFTLVFLYWRFFN